MIGKFWTPVCSGTLILSHWVNFLKLRRKSVTFNFLNFSTFVIKVFCRTLRTRNLYETDFRRNFRKFTHMSRNRKKVQTKIGNPLNLRQNNVIAFRTGNIRINGGPDIFEISRMNARKLVFNFK